MMVAFFENFVSQWWGILVIVLFSLACWLFLSVLLYKPFFKRFYDIALSFIGIIALSPILLLLTVLGSIKMKGNPFFIQKRPGKKEKIFKLIKFRTMNNRKDGAGNLLPDDERLTTYGKLLRATSLDELPELFNIFVGHMSIVGPRPLLVSYLPLYNDEQRKRHNVRPGLTGLAQINGRNATTWEERFENDIKYVNRITFWGDISIVLLTAVKVVKRDGISQNGNATMEAFRADITCDKDQI